MSEPDGFGVSALIAARAWDETPLGATSGWSDSLRTAASICLKSRFPMIVFWGAELVQIYNDAFVQILGDKHPRALGQRARECWPEIWDSIGPMLRGVLETNEATWGENLMLTLFRNGALEECYFTFSYSPIDEGDGVGGVFCAVTETTAAVLREREAHERAAALAELDRSKTVFFNNVSHELRTPLTLMLGPLEELAKIAGDDERTLIDTAHRNSLRLLRLVNTLLDFSRIEAGRAAPALAPTDLAGLTRELSALFQGTIEGFGLRFVCDITLARPVPVDRGMWEKIVLNLLSNAVKFTLEGEIRLQLTDEGERAVLRVSDSGVGIATADLPHIFERFYRARSERARSHEGTGIGLALVSELVALHGGTIGVESEPGVGSTFTVELPLAGVATVFAAGDDGARPNEGVAREYLADIAATAQAVDASPPPPSRAGAGSSAGRVLIVDDNADLRRYVQRLLSGAYDVEGAANGLAALERLRAEPFDVVVLDVMMPEMDGFALLDAIRADAALQQLRVILLSARAGDESAASGLQRGADDYLVKPFRAEDLVARVGVQMRTKRRAANTQNALLDRWFEHPGDVATNETAFHVFADQLPIMVFQQDVEGAISFTNRTWHELLKLPRHPSSHTIEAWTRIVHPEDIGRMLETISAAIPTKSAYTLDYRVRPVSDNNDRDDYRWYTAHGVPHFTADGTFRGWTGSVVDVHEAYLREEAERSLRLEAAKAEREFRALADTIPVIVWTCGSDGAVDWYNSRWFDYTGQTREEAEGWGWQAAHHPEDLQRVMRAWPESVATGKPFEMEFRMRRFDGEYRYFLVRAVPMRDETGAIVRWYGSHIDIQAQKESLERSRRIAETLQGVLLPSPLPYSAQLRVDTVYEAAGTDTLVGGDWFDAIELPDGRYLLSIGDVTGHGLEASIVAARLRHAILDFSLGNDNPARVLERTNEILRLQYDDVYATAVVAFVDAGCRRLTYATAGHLPPLIAYDTAMPAESLATGGVPLGVLPQLQLTSHTVNIVRDTVVALYTDGLVEFARDIEPAERKLAQLVARLVHDTSSPHPAAALRDAMLEGARPSDDLALMIVQFSRATAPPAAGDDVPQVRQSWRFHSSDPHTAQAMRRQITSYLRSVSGDDERLTEAELIVGELLANTVQHAPGLIEIELDWSTEKPVLRFVDEGRGFSGPPPLRSDDELRENGRGLFLIETLADELHIRALPGRGTEMRVVLPLRRPPHGIVPPA